MVFPLTLRSPPLRPPRRSSDISVWFERRFRRRPRTCSMVSRRWQSSTPRHLTGISPSLGSIQLCKAKDWVLGCCRPSYDSLTRREPCVTSRRHSRARMRSTSVSASSLDARRVPSSVRRRSGHSYGDHHKRPARTSYQPMVRKAPSGVEQKVRRGWSIPCGPVTIFTREPETTTTIDTGDVFQTPLTRARVIRRASVGSDQMGNDDLA
jgi:hypothetical protein